MKTIQTVANTLANTSTTNQAYIDKATEEIQITVAPNPLQHSTSIIFNEIESVSNIILRGSNGIELKRIGLNQKKSKH